MEHIEQEMKNSYAEIEVDDFFKQFLPDSKRLDSRTVDTILQEMGVEMKFDGAECNLKRESDMYAPLVSACLPMTVPAMLLISIPY